MILLYRICYLILAYFIGAIPFGWIIVRIITGEDVRTIQSGRTGGTNAMRAGGLWAGAGTAILDVLKSAGTVWLAKYWFPDTIWIHIMAPIMAIIGHNYSLYMIKRNEDGHVRISGGAGGAAALGGSIGLWAPSGLIIILVGILVFYFIGYASVTTISIAFMAFIIFFVQAIRGLTPWAYVLYAVIAEILLIWALRPNIKRLFNGTERLHGFRRRKKAPSNDESDLNVEQNSPA